jgi:hypothetical protein
MNNISRVLITILSMSGIAHASEVSPEYFHGNWCFKSVNFGTQVNTENKSWVFENDGKFLHQNSKTSKKLRHSGYWDLKDNKLQIKPVYLGGYKSVEIVSRDEFIFKWSGDLHVVRGKCK